MSDDTAGVQWGELFESVYGEDDAPSLDGITIRVKVDDATISKPLAVICSTPDADTLLRMVYAAFPLDRHTWREPGGKRYMPLYLSADLAHAIEDYCTRAGDHRGSPRP